MSSTMAFTVLETMIVLAIIGLLVTIAIPGFIKARTTSVERAIEEQRVGSIPFNDPRWFPGVTNVTVVSNHFVEATSMYDTVVAYGSNRYTFVALSSKQLTVGSTGILERVRFRYEPRGTDQYILFVREKTN